MRFAALELPQLDLQLALRDRRAEAEDQPIVLFRKKGAAELIVAVTAPAQAKGAFVGQSVTQAKAIVPGLAALAADPDRARQALRALAEALLSIAPAIEVGPPRALVLDASAARLVPVERLPAAESSDPAGQERRQEQAWGQAVLSTAADFGLTGVLAVADTPEAARLLAAHGAGRRGDRIRIVLPGRSLAAVAQIPLGLALSLGEEEARARKEGWSERGHWPDPGPFAREFLEGLGLRLLGQVAELPPATLAERLGTGVEGLLLLVRGGRPRPLEGYVPVEPLVEQVAFEGRLESSEGLVFALRPLAERICARLSGRGLVASRVALVVETEQPGGDRQISEHPDLPADSGARAGLTLVLPLVRPTARAKVLIDLWRDRLNGLELPAPALGLALRVEETARRQAQLSLGERPQALEALDSVLVRLRARLGEEAVSGMRAAARWLPEAVNQPVPFTPGVTRERSWAPPGAEPAAPEPPGASESGGGALADLPARPTRLFAPEPVERELAAGLLLWRGRRHRVLAQSMPERLWARWSEGAPGQREYVALLLGDGVCVWGFRDEQGRWWMQGIFD